MIENYVLRNLIEEGEIESRQRLSKTRLRSVDRRALEVQLLWTALYDQMDCINHCIVECHA